MQKAEPAPQATAGPASWDEQLERLIALARAGDMDAFGQFYDTTAAWLLSRIRRTVRDGNAEDVLAEVYIKVWRNLGKYDASRSPPAVWLAVIARSTSADHLRREECRGGPARPDVDDSSGLTPSDGHADGPEQHLLQRQQLALVQLALDRLAVDERTVIGMAYFQECTQREISARTGLPLGTVKSLLRKAQAKLRAALRVPIGAGAGRIAQQPQPS